MINESYPDDYDRLLIKAFASLKSDAEIEAFLRDVFTIGEIKEASRRLQIAKKLWLGNTNYLQISSDLKTSTTTVTRVADWLFNKGLNGYMSVLQRLYPKHTNSEKQ